MLAHFEIVPAFTNSHTDVCVDGSCASDLFWLCVFRVGSDLTARKAAFPVWSTTRVKSAIVVSLMVDGSASPDCRIFGRFRPVKMVSRRGAIPPSSGPRTQRSRCRPRAALRPGTFTPRCSFGGTAPGEVPRVHFYKSGRNQSPASA
jgi:hypothetical protein